MKKIWFSIFFFFLIIRLAVAGTIFNPYTGKFDFIQTISEPDGSPNLPAQCKTVQFSNGAVTDNGDGTCSVVTGSGSGTVSSGVTNAVAKYTASTTVDDSSNIFDVGTNVGIGSSAPASRLSILGNGTGTGKILTTRDSIGALKFTVQDDGNVGISTSQPAARLEILGAGTTTGFALSTRDSSGAFKVGIIDSGNLGIGTSAPINLLDVAAGGTIGVAYAGLKTAPSNGLLVQGNVGIGTTVPQGALDVAGSGGITANGSINVPSGQQYNSVGSRVNYNLTVYAAGTVYALTNTAALVDFGTTDPSLTIDTAGTYILFGNLQLKYNAATFAANQTAVGKLRRTNNTAGDVTNATRTIDLRIITTVTDNAGVIVIPPVIYTTANTNDQIQIFGNVSTAPAAGSVDVVSAEIVAIRLY